MNPTENNRVFGPSLFFWCWWTFEKSGNTSPVYRRVCDCKKSCGYILVFDHEKWATGQVYINTATCWVIPLPSNSQYLNGKGIPYKTNDAMLLVVTITLTEGPTPSYTQNNWYIFLLRRCHMASWKKNNEFKFRKTKKCGRIQWEHFFW